MGLRIANYPLIKVCLSSYSGLMRVISRSFESSSFENSIAGCTCPPLLPWQSFYMTPAALELCVEEHSPSLCPSFCLLPPKLGDYRCEAPHQDRLPLYRELCSSRYVPCSFNFHEWRHGRTGVWMNTSAASVQDEDAYVKCTAKARTLVAQACNLSTQKVESRGSGVQGHPSSAM